MGSLVFIDYDNNKQMITKEDLSNIIKGIKKYQLFLVHRKAELISSIEGLSDEELQSFDVQKAFEFSI